MDSNKRKGGSISFPDSLIKEFIFGKQKEVILFVNGEEKQGMSKLNESLAINFSKMQQKLNRHFKPYRQEEIDKLWLMHMQGIKVKKIAKTLGRTKGAIAQVLYQIKIRNYKVNPNGNHNNPA